VAETLWASRLRWRLRGAKLWPTFVVVVLLEGMLLQVLPVSEDHGPGLFAAILLAGVPNLVLVAVAAPLAGRWLRRRHPTMPKVVATDRAGVALLLAGVVVVVGLGLAHRPAVRAAQDDLAAQAAQARRYFVNQAPAQYQANLNHLSTWKQGPNLYRTCVAGADPQRAYCVFVNTDQSPPGVTRDHDQRPNAEAMRGAR
jgi:hypothetical protein